MVKIFVKVFILLFVLSFWGCSSNEKKPNIVIIFSDELDPEYLGCYGGKYSSPNIDKLASEGIRFNRAYSSASVCMPARFSILTGQYPGRCLDPKFNEEFPDTIPYSISLNTLITKTNVTIADVLKENGYYTGIAGKWHLSEWNENDNIPILTEDSDLDDPLVNEKLIDLQNKMCEKVKEEGGFDFAQSVLWKNFDETVIKPIRFHNIPWISKGADSFLESAGKQDKPFFLYYTPTSVHGPSHDVSLRKNPKYTPGGIDTALAKYDLVNKKELLQKFENNPDSLNHREAGIVSLDHQVGLIVNKLKEIGELDNTLIIYMADHNTEPGKSTVYEKGFHIPMIVRWPDTDKKGITTDALIQSVDIFPSLLEYLNISYDTEQPIDGLEVLETLQGTSEKGRDYIYYEAGYQRAIFDGSYKYVALRYPQFIIDQMQTDQLAFAANHINKNKQPHAQIALSSYPNYFDSDQFYDIEDDPYEMNNLIGNKHYSEKIGKLKTKLKNELLHLPNSFDLTNQPFMKTQQFKNLISKTRAQGIDYIPWLEKHNGDFKWPPQK